MKTIIVGLYLLSTATFAAIEPVNLTCEYLTNPERIDMPDPRFYWQVASDENGEAQMGCQLLVATTEELLAQDKGDAFDSGKVASSESIQIVYEGKPLESSSDYFWKVRVWGKDGKTWKWSQPAKFATGLMNKADWGNAQWIAWRDHAEWDTAWWKRKEIELKCQEWYLPTYFGAGFKRDVNMHIENKNTAVKKRARGYQAMSLWSGAFAGCLIAAMTLADEPAHPSLSFTPSNIAQLQENVNSGLLGPVRLVQENRIVLERE